MSEATGPSVQPVTRVAPAGIAVRRVYNAVEQVADQIRELIAAGVLPPGHRLPTEALLSAQFGVSRATVREAMKVLSGQNLIRTTKGPSGGNFVSVPAPHHVEDFLTSSINLLSQSSGVSLEELLEAREHLEIPAASLAASRHTEHDLAVIRGAIPEPFVVDADDGVIHKRDFHWKVMRASGNQVLTMAAQPILSVLARTFKHASPSQVVYETVREHHRAILCAIEARDPAASAAETRRHLEFLAPIYEKAWPYTIRREADTTNPPTGAWGLSP
jgi:GntR family transcriptional repressor for pyruvate dehydrogenase complex